MAPYQRIELVHTVNQLRPIAAGKARMGMQLLDILRDLSSRRYTIAIGSLTNSN